MDYQNNNKIGNQAILEEIRTAIQLAIDKSLRRDANTHSFVSQGRDLTGETGKSSQEEEGSKQAEPQQDKSSYFRKRFAVILGIAGFVVMCSLFAIRITLSTLEPVPENPALKDPVSSTGINYKLLQQFLETQDWRRADEQTMNRLVQIANRAGSGDPTRNWLNSGDVDSLFCDDLRVINQLWSESTDNRLSFATQARLWRSVGGTIDTKNVALETRERFSRVVGWQEAAVTPVSLNWLYQNIANVPLEEIQEGHLPSAIGQYEGDILVGNGNEFAALTSRLQNCGIIPAE